MKLIFAFCFLFFTTLAFCQTPRIITSVQDSTDQQAYQTLLFFYNTYGSQVKSFSQDDEELKARVTIEFTTFSEMIAALAAIRNEFGARKGRTQILFESQ